MAETEKTTAAAKKPSGKNLYQRLSAIMGDVERIPKNGYNSFHKYAYALESDVKDGCRKAMIEHGIVLITNVISAEQVAYTETNKTGDPVTVTKDIVRVTADYTFVNADSPEDRLTVRIISDGQDKNDKAPYKAMTGGIKYALMNTLLIPTGDDPEKDSAPGHTSAEHGNGKSNTRQGNGGNGKSKFDRIKALRAMDDMLYDMTYGVTEEVGPLLHDIAGFDDLDQITDAQIPAVGKRIRERHEQWQENKKQKAASAAVAPGDEFPEDTEQEKLPF